MLEEIVVSCPFSIPDIDVEKDCWSDVPVEIRY
jgi:hypothetical protein